MNASPSALVDKYRSAKLRGEKVAVLTGYDYPTARLLDESGIDIILVGDSLGMVVLGHPDTTHVTMADMMHHCSAVARGVKNALVVCDLPYGCYTTPEAAVENARRLVAAGAQAVKLEGGVTREEEIAAIVGAGIPVMGHIGMLPQSVKIEGGYKVKGGTPAELELLIADAKAVERGGAFAVVTELINTEVSGEIQRSVSIPTIGIGAGNDCDGQVLVFHDVVGLFPWFKPKFVTRKAHLGKEIRSAVSDYIREVKGAA